MSFTVLPAGTDEHVWIVLTVLTLNRNYWMDHTNNPSEQTDQAANTVLKSPCCGCIVLLLLFHQAYLRTLSGCQTLSLCFALLQ